MKKLLTILFSFALATGVQSQDYSISFEGSGDITNVDSTIIKNLTQGTSLTVYGDDQLNLVSNITGMRPLRDNMDNNLSIYPNPIKEYGTVKFNVPRAGIITTELYNISGKMVLQKSRYFERGTHFLQISGMGYGFYNLNVKSTEFNYAGKIVSQSNNGYLPQISFTGQANNSVNEALNKSKNTEVQMQYNTGDRLKLTAYSGNYSTVVIDIPTESKSIAFKFVACTDNDENNYSVVEIGAQTWMAENLKTTKFPGSDDIPLVEEDSNWDALVATDKAYSYYNNDSNNGDIYGALYTWAAAMNGASSTINNPSGVQGVCPEGWHLPSDAEWTELVDYVGEENAGGKLKEIGTTHWDSPNEGATNEFGFTALPGGYRNVDGTFLALSFYACFWTATEEGNFAKDIYLFDNHTYVDRSSYNKPGGLSVRCVKDD